MQHNVSKYAYITIPQSLKLGNIEMTLRSRRETWKRIFNLTKIITACTYSIVQYLHIGREAGFFWCISLYNVSLVRVHTHSDLLRAST